MPMASTFEEAFMAEPPAPEDPLVADISAPGEAPMMPSVPLMTVPPLMSALSYTPVMQYNPMMQCTPVIQTQPIPTSPMPVAQRSTHRPVVPDDIQIAMTAALESVGLDESMQIAPRIVVPVVAAPEPKDTIENNAKPMEEESDESDSDTEEEDPSESVKEDLDVLEEEEGAITADATAPPKTKNEVSQLPPVPPPSVVQIPQENTLIEVGTVVSIVSDMVVVQSSPLASEEDRIQMQMPVMPNDNVALDIGSILAFEDRHVLGEVSWQMSFRSSCPAVSFSLCRFTALYILSPYFASHLKPYLTASPSCCRSLKPLGRCISRSIRSASIHPVMWMRTALALASKSTRVRSSARLCSPHCSAR